MKPIKTRIEEIDIALVDETLLAQAEEWLSACERCADNAVVALDYVLDALTGADPSRTEYVMCRPAQCPFCLARDYGKDTGRAVATADCGILASSYILR